MSITLNGSAGVDAPGFSVDGVPIDERAGPWIDFVLLNGWEPFVHPTYALPGYYKGPDGRVYLRGAARADTGPATNVAIFNLPVGYTPFHRMIIPAVASSGAARITVFPDAFNGIVQANVTLAGTSWFFFDGITFLAGQ